MRSTKVSFFIACIVLSGIALLCGCAGSLRNKQLEKVAKDWSMVIRASQVIPVYPLTEDLQPGDILLVTTPIDKQADAYKKKGFLPLDQLIGRIYPDHQGFYRNRYGTATDAIIQNCWQVSDNPDSSTWHLAPRVAFPTYKFSATSKSGLNLALPIQGVPFALGLMNTSDATGSVTIANAYTYGIDNVTLWRQVQDWASSQRDFLYSYEPVGKSEKYHYLRVITRVFLADSVSVSVVNASTFDSKATVGAQELAKQQGLTGSKSDSGEARSALELLSAEVPGGNVSLNTATNRSVGLSESFDRPLVIGYLGFDIPIMKGGRLGLPVSTLTRLTGKKKPAAELPKYTSYHLASLSHMYAALCSLEVQMADDAKIKRVLNELNSLQDHLPLVYPCNLYELSGTGMLTERREAGKKVDRNGFQSVLDYIKDINDSNKLLADKLAGIPPAAEQAQYEMDMSVSRSAYEEINKVLNTEPVIMEAVDLVFLGF